MGPYGFSLALGLTGLAVMAFLGFVHHGPGNGHGHGGHGHPGAHGGHDLGHGHAGHHAGHGHAGHGHAHSESTLGKLGNLLSPRVLFSFAAGVGAIGLALKSFLVEPLILAGAVVGGVLFERLLVTPVWNLLFRFESRPAALLESAIMEEAHAAADFDASGQGLIRFELDGQVVQLLGTLTAEDKAAGRRVRSGDLLRIEDIDTARNRCTVSFAGHRPGALP